MQQSTQASPVLATEMMGRADGSWFDVWWPMISLTPLIFGLLVKRFWSARRRAKFWIVLGVLLVLHVVVLGVIIRAVGRVPTLWNIPFGIVEAGVLYAVLKNTVGAPTGMSA